MKMPWLRTLWVLVLCAPLLVAQEPLNRPLTGLGSPKDAPLPRKFDLRDVGGVTPIKKQQGGTCWAHGTMAAIESHLLVSGAWKKFGHAELPAFSEYHLDWWNGFNRHQNRDLPDATKDPTGLSVHFGGDYRVAAAYISRGDGVVYAPLPEVIGKNIGYDKAPEFFNPAQKKFYVRDIEWFTLGDELKNIDTIKRRIVTHGAIGTAMAVNMKAFMSKDFVHYQPIKSTQKPNHAIAIVGWDDDKTTADADKKAPKPGAWLIKNSWGLDRGDKGYYWISYYDKVCCRDPEMGAVSFRNIEPLRYQHVYYHDYHGWRATISDISKACNVFKATGKQDITAVSFYTTADNAKYTVAIYRKFDIDAGLTGLQTTLTGVIERTGFHTVDLAKAVRVEKGDEFVICLEVSAGGQAIDRTSEIEVLLDQPDKKQPDKKQPIIIQPKKGPMIPKGPRGPNGGPIVLSKANPEESYYWNGTIWRDLYEYRFDNPSWAMFDRSANFCMKALAVDVK